MAITLADALILIGADDSQLDQDLDKTEKSVGARFGKLAGNISNVMTSVVTGGVVAATGAVVGLGVAAFDASHQITQVENNFKRALGASEFAAEKMAETVQDAFVQGLGGSILEAGDMILTATQQLGTQISDDLSPEAMIELTKQAQMLEKTLGVDFADSIHTVGILMKTGLAANTQEAMDIVAAGFQNNLNLSDDFLDTLGEYSEDFARIGFTAEETLGFINRGLEAGILNTDKIGDLVNEFGIQLRDPGIRDSLKDIDGGILAIFDGFQEGSITEKDALEGMLARLEAIEDPIAQDAAGVQLFRSMWEDLGSEAVLALGGIEEGMITVDGAREALAAGTDSLRLRWQKFTRGAVLAVVPLVEKLFELAESILPSVEEAFRALEPILGALGNLLAGDTSFEEFATTTEDTVAGIWPRVKWKLRKLGVDIVKRIILIGEALVPQLLIWSQKFMDWVVELLPVITAGLSDLMTGIMEWITDNGPGITTQLADWTAAFLNWTVTMSVELQAALWGLTADILVWLLDSGPQLSAMLFTWLTVFTDWALGLSTAVLEKMAEFRLSLTTWLTGEGSTLTTDLQVWVDAFLIWASDLWEKLLPLLQALLTEVIAWIELVVPVLTELFLEWISSFIDWAAEVWPTLEEKLLELVNSMITWVLIYGPIILEQLLTWAGAFVEWVTPAIADLLLALPSLSAELIVWILDSLPQIITALAEWATEFVVWVGPIINELVTWITEELIPAILEEIPKIVDALISFIDDTIRDVVPALLDLLSAIITVVEDDMLPGIRTAAGDLGKAFVETMLQAMGGLGTMIIDLLNDALPNDFGVSIDLPGILGGTQTYSVDFPDNPIPGGSRDGGGPFGAGVPFGIGDNLPFEVIVPNQDGNAITPDQLAEAFQNNQSGTTIENLTVQILAGNDADETVGNFVDGLRRVGVTI